MRNRAEIIVAWGVTLTALLMPQDARADACDTVLNPYNANVERVTKEYVANVKRVLGVPPKNLDWSSPDTCRNSLPILRARVLSVSGLVDGYNQVLRRCKKLQVGTNSSQSAFTADEMAIVSPIDLLSWVNAHISNCEQIIAKADTPTQQSTAASQDDPEQNSCPRKAPPKNWQGTPNANYCANANCVDRGSALYGNLCFPPSPDVVASGNPAGGAAATGKTTQINYQEPRRFKGAAPDVRGDVMSLGDAIANLADGSPEQAKKIKTLRRSLADHGIHPVDPACHPPVSGTSPRMTDVALRWHPYQIKKEAIDRSHLCDDVAEGDAKDVCREQKYGEAVMWAEPAIAGQCRTANAPNFDADAIADCAKQKFLNAWIPGDGIVPAPLPDSWVMPGWCDPKQTPAQRKNALRDALLKALAAPSEAGGPAAAPANPAPADTTAAANPASPVPPPAPAADDDEAYCNYMGREVVRGELTPSPATAIPPGCRATVSAALTLKAQQQGKPFSMNPDETDREIARLRAAPPPATVQPVPK